MTQTTEAACLLQSGAMYSRRLGLKGPAGEAVFAGLKRGAVSLYFGDAPIFHFDLDGRWQRAYVDGTHYLKGFDAAVRSVDRERDGAALILRRGTLPFGEAADLDDSIRSVALGLIADLDSDRLDILPCPAEARPFAPDDLREFLERVASWDSAAWFAHRERHLATYGPLPFLPPDCPAALVLQATLGDLGGLAFGGAKPAEHYARTPAEFLDHARDVARLTGRRIGQHRGFFLAGADILARPLGEVLAFLRAIEATFPGKSGPDGCDRWDDFPGKVGAVQAFLDDFSRPLPDREGWRTLRAANLGRVTLGVESGDSKIRENFGKSWIVEDLQRTVGELKGAGIGLGLVVLVGIEGSSNRHVEATAGLLGSLPLGRADLVSLVDVGALSDTPGGTSDLAAAQVAGLKAWASEGGGARPKVVAYNPNKGGS